jgi:hypothetical protein
MVYGGFLYPEGSPNKSLDSVDFIESPNLEWMRTGGKKTHFRKLPYISTLYIYIILYVNQYIWCAIYFTMELIHDLNSTSMYIIYIQST